MFKLSKGKLFLCLSFYFQISRAFESIPEENQIDCNYTSSTDQWRESCNWCRCTETRRALCTRRGCPPALNTRLSEGKECKGDPQWKKECNWCSCVEGRAVCTTSSCAGPKVERASLAVESNEQLLGKSFERSGNETECQMITDDGSWRNKCNWCRCDGEKRLCTRKLCHPDLEEKSEGTSDCNGKVKWKNGCEICECVNGHSVCSPEFCKPDQEPLCKVKRKGSRFREGCNWCACRDGRPICTEIGCSPDNPRIEGTPICEGEISWKQDCNWCRCVNGEAKCTEKFCGKDNNCKEGISWVEGCNTCICTSGSPFCTRRACSDHVANEIQPLVLKHRAEELTTIASTLQSQSKICTEGSEWMSDCNFCTCRNGLALCTLIACSPGNDTVTHPPCTEDSQWKENCNVCKCTNGIPVCTRTDCDDEKLNQQPESNGLPKPSVPTFNLNPSEDCTDGSRWKRECNWCNCMNGKGACTLMGCLRGFKNNGPQCENGSVWRGRNCSICHCENEKAVCEDSSCHKKTSETGATPEKGEPVNKILPNKDCTEGSRWRVDCNWCFCSSGFGSCTEIHCSPGADDEKPQCTNDSQWMKNNITWCFCDKEKAICSPSKCVSGNNENATEQETSTITAETPSAVSPSTKMGKEISSESRNQTPLCSEGSRWVNRCNWCTCANGVGLCEQKACTSDNYREMDKTCEGKSRWKDGCNWCKCVNGKGNCTTKDCTKKTEVNDPPIEKCKVGSSWLEDCNICVCTNKTTVCTKKECKPTTRGANAVCSDDKVWKENCNTCRCLHGEVACTRELCQSTPTPRGTLPEICHLPAVKPDTELCAGFEARWTFNVKTEKCEPVVYGGCGGTENLFTNEQECLLTCGYHQQESNKDSDEDPRERCFMPIVPGPCFGKLIRYAFFTERNRCEKFYYGGCQGNQNNFVTLEECRSICGGSLPPVDDSEDIKVEA